MAEGAEVGPGWTEEVNRKQGKDQRGNDLLLLYDAS